jgi:hypothetical protein
MELPYIGDWNLRRNFSLSEKTRKGNRDRQLKFQRRHKYDKKAFRPEDLNKLPPGRQPTWAVHGLVDPSGVVTFCAACRVDGSINGLCGQHGKEVELSPAIGVKEAIALTQAFTNTLQPVGNKSRVPETHGHWIGGRNCRESLVYWSTFCQKMG